MILWPPKCREKDIGPVMGRMSRRVNPHRSVLRVATWNVNGKLRHTLPVFWDWMQESFVDILLVQDTRSLVDELRHDWKFFSSLSGCSGLGFVCGSIAGTDMLTINTSIGAGVAILFAPSASPHVFRSDVLDEGRIVASVLDFRGVRLIIFCLYAPPNPVDRSAHFNATHHLFRDYISRWHDHRATNMVLMGGDFNECIGSVGSSGSGSHQTHWLPFLKNSGFEDLYESIHEEELDAFPGFTHHTPHSDSHSRIDAFWGSLDSCVRCVGIEVDYKIIFHPFYRQDSWEFAPISDHFPVVADLDIYTGMHKRGTMHTPPIPFGGLSRKVFREPAVLQPEKQEQFFGATDAVTKQLLGEIDAEEDSAQHNTTNHQTNGGTLEKGSRKGRETAQRSWNSSIFGHFVRSKTDFTRFTIGISILFQIINLEQSRKSIDHDDTHQHPFFQKW